MKKLLLALLCLSIVACEPKVFGVPQSTWNTLTPAQKQQVIDGYMFKQQIAPIQSAITTASTLINKANE